jgi:hypothetical protein
LDLTTLYNVFGEALTFTSLKLIVIHVDGDVHVDIPDCGISVDLVSGAAINIFDPTGIIVTTGTITITQLGTVEVNCQMILAD